MNIIYVILHTENDYDGWGNELELKEEVDEEGFLKEEFAIGYSSFKEAMENKPKDVGTHSYAVIPVRIK